jgi:LmbE family N-acetylglucosaminyl deacetylase
MTYAKAMQALPFIAPEQLLGERGLIVIAPHPDDETLGCGGLLAWASQSDLLRHVVFLTDGERSHPETTHDLAAIRRLEATVAAAHLGLTRAHLSFLGLPDGGLLTLIDEERRCATQWLRCLAVERSPCLIAVTAATDAHCDHQAAYALIAEAAGGVPGVQIMSYPVWSWLSPDEPQSVCGVRVDITEQRQRKASAIEAYTSQLGRLALDAEGFKLPKELLRHVQSDTEVFLCSAL